MPQELQISSYQRAATDFRNGMAQWSIWTLLGFSDIRQRYKRSKFGQMWITLSQAIFIVSIGIVYSYLFKQPTGKLIPMLAVNMVIWTLITGIVTDSTNVCVQAGIYLRQDALPKTVFIMRLLVRNLIIFAHNLLIVPLVLIYFWLWPGAGVPEGTSIWPGLIGLMAIPGLILLLVAAFLVALLLGILCTRYRDLPQIVANLLQIAFFVTPVMWPIDLLGDKGWLVSFNPFAVFLRIVAEPLRGTLPGPGAYAAAFVIIATLFAITWPLFAKYRARIVYWL